MRCGRLSDMATPRVPDRQDSPGETASGGRPDGCYGARFFGNADHVRAAVKDAATADGIGVVVLDCETMPFVDVTAARMLNQLAAEPAPPRGAAGARRRDRQGPRYGRRCRRP